jgi:general secretion pathway protein B
MSLILEALRKSEAERQRGRSPGLFVEQRPARSRDRRVPAWAWGLAALLVAVLLAWGWREWQRPAVVVVTTAAPSADTVAEAVPTQMAPRTEPAPGEPGSLAPITLAPAPPPQVAVAPAPAPPAAPPAEPVAYLPGLDALLPSDRAALPPLKLSMHVYADTPSQRFVILDGQRLGEGASPASGVVLEEIRRDGLVLSVNGQRLLLARP